MSVTAEPTSPSVPVENRAAIPDVPIYRLTVEQYHAMAAAGILAENDPVELLEGWLVPKMTKNPPHSTATRLVRDALRSLPLPGWYVDSQEPITTLESEPEPDVVVMRGSAREYASRHPGPGDVCLVVEVSDTSLDTDRGNKKRLYARAGISVYWIVNLVERRIELYTDPSGPADAPEYRQHHVYGPNDTIPVLIDSNEVAALSVADLLP